MMTRSENLIPGRADSPAELDFSSAEADDFESLARDRFPVRSMHASDLAAVAAIDRRLTGADRFDYLRQRLEEALELSGVRVSLVAEIDGMVAGFAMARVDLGAYGQFEPTAVIDTIGVDPASADKGVARALLSQLMVNLSALRVERLRTVVAWDDPVTTGFFAHMGFAPEQRLVLRLALT